MSELPRGWCRSRLEELVTCVGGGTPSKGEARFWTGDIPWVSPKDMKTPVIRDAIDHITPEAVEQSATNLVPAGTVLVVTRSGILRHSLPVAITSRQVALNQDIKALIPSGGTCVDYVAWAIRAFDRTILGSCSKTGTTVQNIETPKLLNFEIPLPPLAEQRRIVAAIEEHFSRLDAAEESLRRAQQRLDVLRAGVLGEAIGDSPERSLGEFSTIHIGTTPSRRMSELWGGGVPWVSSGEVAFCRIRETRETVSAEAIKSPERLHPPGTVLLAMIGEGKTRGQAAILDVAATHNQNSAAIRLDRSICNPEWLFYVLMARYEETRRAGSGAQQPALNRARVAALPIPLPEPDDQCRIVAEVERRLSLVDALAAAIDAALKRFGALRRSILKRAFTGKLVSHDPRDEPAAVLLERIKAEREARV